MTWCQTLGAVPIEAYPTNLVRMKNLKTNSFLFQMNGKYLILKKIINNDKTVTGLA